MSEGSAVDTTENQVVVRFDSITFWTAFHKQLSRLVFSEKGNVGPVARVSRAP